MPLGPWGSVMCLFHVLVPEWQISSILRIANSGKDSRTWGQSSALVGAVTPLGEPQASLQGVQWPTLPGQAALPGVGQGIGHASLKGYHGFEPC